jgi:hypothetical protein
MALDALGPQERFTVISDGAEVALASAKTTLALLALEALAAVSSFESDITLEPALERGRTWAASCATIPFFSSQAGATWFSLLSLHKIIDPGPAISTVFSINSGPAFRAHTSLRRCSLFSLVSGLSVACIYSVAPGRADESRRATFSFQTPLLFRIAPFYPLDAWFTLIARDALPSIAIGAPGAVGTEHTLKALQALLRLIPAKSDGASLPVFAGVSFQATSFGGLHSVLARRPVCSSKPVGPGIPLFPGRALQTIEAFFAVLSNVTAFPVKTLVSFDPGIPGAPNNRGAAWFPRSTTQSLSSVKGKFGGRHAFVGRAVIAPLAVICAPKALSRQTTIAREAREAILTRPSLFSVLAPRREAALATVSLVPTHSGACHIAFLPFETVLSVSSCHPN